MARYSSTNGSVSVRNGSKLIVQATCSWTVPATISCVNFQIWGAGGGGGAKCCCDCYHQGTGGAPGSYASLSIPTSPGCVYSITVGAGGSYGAAVHYNCFGTAGGATYISGYNITTLCTVGGEGGNNMCYTYCNCSQSYGRSCACNASCAYTSSNSSVASLNDFSTQTGPSQSCMIGPTGGMSSWTDSQSMYYVSISGGGHWHHNMIKPQGHCCTDWATETKSGCLFGYGMGGQGALFYSCECKPAGPGANGAVIITY